MKGSPAFAKHLLIAFVLALVFYAASFSLIEHRRNRQGPWQVDFKTDLAGRPFVTVSHEMLRIANVRIRFLDEQITATNLDQTVAFSRPLTNVPYGQVLFIDTTFLPGTVALDFFGHEVQLMPRVLMVDGREIPWRSDIVIEAAPSEKVPPTPRRSQRRR